MIRSKYLPFFVCFLLSLYSTTTFAQKAELELAAGPAMVSTRAGNGDNGDRELKIAPLAGVGFNYHFTNHWSVATNLLYERKGVHVKGEIAYDPFFSYNSNFVQYKLVNNLNYISLPLMARFTFGKKIQWYAGAGGYISYLLKAQQHVTIYGTPTYKQNTDVTRYYSNTDAGIRMAIGAAVPVTEKLKLTGSLNESIGLVDIWKNTDTYASQQPKQSIKTNSLSLLVGISYVLKGK